MKINLKKNFQSDKRKVLIFSEFADTANYIYKKLLKITIKFLNILLQSPVKKKKKYIKKFDASSDEKEDKYNVLVATIL